MTTFLSPKSLGVDWMTSIIRLLEISKHLKHEFALIYPAVAGGFFTTSVTWEAPKQHIIPFCGNQFRFYPSLGWEDPQEKEMATHSIILAWEIPWTEEPGGPQSKGLQRVGHN